jgi:hypothetical protein
MRSGTATTSHPFKLGHGSSLQAGASRPPYVRAGGRRTCPAPALAMRTHARTHARARCERTRPGAVAHLPAGVDHTRGGAAGQPPHTRGCVSVRRRYSGPGRLQGLCWRRGLGGRARVATRLRGRRHGGAVLRAGSKLRRGSGWPSRFTAWTRKRCCVQGRGAALPRTPSSKLPRLGGSGPSPPFGLGPRRPGPGRLPCRAESRLRDL